MSLFNRTAEDLEPYAFEAAYLNQMNNEARFLINGKGIVHRDNGIHLFFTVEDCDVEFFDFGGTILDEYLTELTYIDQEEVEQFAVLQSLDKQLFNQFGLHVVSAVYAENDENDIILKDIIIIEPESKAYFQFDLAEIDSIGKGTIEELRAFDACPLSKPYFIAIVEDGSVIVKE